MNKFTVHDSDSAPEKSKPLLDNSEKAFGMIPNLHGVMAESPQLLEGYQKLHELAQSTAFNKEELTVVWQSINVAHQCHYCVPAHTGIAKNMGVDDKLIEALRNEDNLNDSKLENLRKTTLELLRERGHVSESQLNAFYEAGYNHQHLLDIVLILSQKVMSNYVNHLANTPVDAAFEKFEWKPENQA